MSLTRTLTLMVATTVLLVTLITAAWGFFVSNHQLEEVFDAELAQSTRIVQGLVRYTANIQSRETLARILAQTLQLPDEAFQEVESDEILAGGAGHKYERKIAFEVWSAEQDPLLDTLNAEDARGLSPGYSWIQVGEFQWRTFTLRDPATGFWIRTAQREDVRKELSQELALGNILPIVLALPFLIIAVVIAVQLGFRPLLRLERPIRHMEPEHIHPLDERHAPREVAGLVNAVNGLLKRLNQALDREKRFSADAAHELRTPLTALRLNLEKLGDKHPDDFKGLTQSVDRMVHLVEQMLLMSRVDSGTDFRPQPCNLSAFPAGQCHPVQPGQYPDKHPYPGQWRGLQYHYLRPGPGYSRPGPGAGTEPFHPTGSTSGRRRRPWPGYRPAYHRVAQGPPDPARPCRRQARTVCGNLAAVDRFFRPVCPYPLPAQIPNNRRDHVQPDPYSHSHTGLKPSHRLRQRRLIGR